MLAETFIEGATWHGARLSSKSLYNVALAIAYSLHLHRLRFAPQHGSKTDETADAAVVVKHVLFWNSFFVSNGDIQPSEQANEDCRSTNGSPAPPPGTLTNHC